MLPWPASDRIGARDDIHTHTLVGFVSGITLGTGRTTVLKGTVHLLMFAVFLFFAVAP